MKSNILFWILILVGCQTSTNQNFIDNESSKLIGRIGIPEGYERVEVDSSSFAFYLRHLDLKPDGSEVKLYNGALKNRQDVHAAVIDISVGKTDLQQCADAIMRLRAEYLFQKNNYDDINFNFTSGHTVRYADWAEGIRPVVSGNSVSFKQKGTKDYSYKNFLKYMQTIFMYCGSYSLEKELIAIDDHNKIAAGDVFIQGGFPGHAVIVLDVAQHIETKEKIFLLGQSYMPAQEIHVLKNFTNNDLSPWYSINFGTTLQTPEWSFTRKNLKRFPAN